MQCDICHRPANSRLPFYCALCARDTLYHQRIQLAQTFVQRERLGKEVEQNIASTSKSTGSDLSKGSQPSDSQPNLPWMIQREAAQQTLSAENTESILSCNQVLRKEIQEIKDDIARRKARFQRRRFEFTSAKQELLQSQANGNEPMLKGIRRIEHKWDSMHKKTAESRQYLCKEAALLYGLEQRKRRKGGLGRDVYYIGGIPIADLRDLNNTSPAQVTASATNLAHLVHLVSHYLGLRLPAEITIAHSDYSLPTIFSPSASHTGHDIPFPGSIASQSSENSPSASRHVEQRSLPKPRPLHLDKKLSALAKDDQVAYASFVEGITVLAWDIAWLCKTQGLNVGDNSWEEVCAMGKNLWQILLAPHVSPPVPGAMPSRNAPQKIGVSQPPDVGYRPPTTEPPNVAPPRGYFSHNTIYGFLAAAAGSDLMRTWRLQNAIKITEKVKAMLLAERTGAEWEILEGNEWEVEENEADLKGEPNLVNRFPIDETGILVKPEAYEGSGQEAAGEVGRSDGEGRRRSTSGWMKLKNRESEH